MSYNLIKDNDPDKIINFHDLYSKILDEKIFSDDNESDTDLMNVANNIVSFWSESDLSPIISGFLIINNNAPAMLAAIIYSALISKKAIDKNNLSFQQTELNFNESNT